MMTYIKTAWKNSSLRKKWFYSIALTIVGVYAIVCIIIYAALHAWLLENEKGDAARTVSDLQGYFATQSMQLSVYDLQQQKGLMQAILTQEQTVRLFANDGTELLQINDYSSSTPLVQNVQQTIELRVVDDMDVIVVQDLIPVGNRAVVIQLIHPLTSFKSMMKYIVTTMLIMGLGALLLSGAISHVLAGRFVQPLKELRSSMLQVKERGVSESSLEIEYSNDELGDVLQIYKEMLRQLDESFQRQQQFVFDASHELRTPIQAIEGNLNLIKRWGKHDQQVLEDSLAISLEEINRMKKLMEELLQLARQQKKEELSYVPILPLLGQLQQQYSPFVKINIKEKEQYLRISEQALMQIMRNLIENSVRYCTRQPEILITVEMKDDCLMLMLEDNGIGIEEHHLPYIFDRFYRGDDARLHVEGSTGLGLSIVKMLVEKYEGKISVKSKVEKGTTFIVRFPIGKC